VIAHVKADCEDTACDLVLSTPSEPLDPAVVDSVVSLIFAVTHTSDTDAHHLSFLD
jgi:hypothetical protein